MLSKIGFIGCGNMASAIIKGIVNQGYIIPENIFVYDIDELKTNALINELGVVPSDDIPSLAKSSDVIFLCVKPQMVDEPLKALKENMSKDKILVSILAGVKISTVSSYFKNGTKIIRVMPNLCLMYNQGASAVSCYNCSNEESEFVFNIFNSLGKAVFVSEEQLDAVTALSGSGPAFVFSFLKEAVKEATKLGLDEKDAFSLAVQTLKGSAEVLEKSGKTTDELIDMVSSKGGTTIAGLNAMKECGFNTAVGAGVTAAFNRSKELSNLK